MANNDIGSVCVVGAGAIGSLFAGHFASTVETSVLTRRSIHAHELNRHGLKITGKSNLQIKIRASMDPADLGEPDLVIVATKATAVESIAKTLSGHFADATIMTVQNGLGCEDVIAQAGDWPIISAITFMSGTKHSDIHVEYELDTATWLGPWVKRGPPIEVAKQVEALINRSGLKATAFDDVRPAQWSKLLFNSCVNSIGAVTNLPHVKAFANRNDVEDLGHLVFDMMEEGKRVAAAEGIELHEDPWDMNVEAVSHGSTGHDEYAHIFSMLDDVRSQRLTEVDWLTGAVVREAHRLGIPVPIHETMYRLVKALEQSWRR
jgi:2-dehydropantoate 2-reductase